MKLLLLGEYSGLHSNLNLICKEFGIDSFFSGSANGFRKLQSDLSFESNIPGIFGRALTALNPIFNLHKLTNFDVVQAITFEQFHPLINDWLLKCILKTAERKFSLITGCDSFLNNYLSQKHVYPEICKECLRFDLKMETCVTKKYRSVMSQNLLYTLSDRLIPMQIEYLNAFKDTCYTSKTTKVHRLPIYLKNFSPHKKKQINVRKKLRVLHGLNRYGFKGTRIVEECCALLKKKNKSNILIDIKGKMPLLEYLEIIKDYDLIIDQLYMESWGYNALFAMAQGIPVISCTTDNALNAIGIHFNPFISIKPNAESLLNTLEFLSENYKLRNEYSEKSFNFIFNEHSHETIINQFLKTWKTNL